MTSVEWAGPAVTDLQAIKVNLAERYDEAVAEEAVEALIAAAAWLAKRPRVGPALGYRHWRKWKPRGSYYLLVYEPHAGGVRVLRVRHERSDWREQP